MLIKPIKHDLSVWKQNAEKLRPRIGNTPLINIPLPEDCSPNVLLHAKAEWYNPAGSVKDRPAFNMVWDGLVSGKLFPGKTLLDATSGNTGIAYAMMGAAIGFPVHLVVPENVSPERKKILHAYGAKVTYSDPALSSDGAIMLAQKLIAENPSDYYFPDQYNNPKNWEAHYQGTAMEIWEQTNHQITHFIAGLGTSGTCMGCGKKLKELNPDINILAMQPDSPFHGLEGLKRMDSAIKPGIYDEHLPDGQLEVETESAYLGVSYLARHVGLMVGISSGAAFYAAYELCRSLKKGTVVCIFPDNADKYLSEEFWKKQWL